jgi:hypothetical protein
VREAPEEQNRFRSNKNSNASADGSTKPLPTHADMLAAVQPLAGVDYAEQLKLKDNTSRQICTQLVKEMRECGAEINTFDDILCPTRANPAVKEYR